MKVFNVDLTSAVVVLRIAARSFTSLDIGTIRMCGELIAANRDLDTLFSTGRDTDEIEEYEIVAREQARLIDCISKTKVSTISGLLAKAECALLKPIERGYDDGIRLGLSVCRDLVLLRSSTLM